LRVLDRLRRPATLLITTLLPASLALAACGGGDDEMLEGLDAVSISGEPGATPKLDWKGKLKPEKPEATVIEEGDGAALEKGDVVLVDFTVANGWTHEEHFSSYDDTSLSTLVTVGAEKEPASVTDLLASGFIDQIKAGQTVGSRIAVTAGSDVVFGDYIASQASTLLASLDIGNEDGLLFVADLTSIAEPSGTPQKAPAWAPALVEKDGLPTGFDFTGTPAPSGKLEVATLVKGDGPVVKSGQTILASYLGQVSKGPKPFDESYSTGRGIEAVVGGEAASVVKGWSEGLVGLPVGSRVLLQIPPKLGYGKKGREGIPANSTLYFVVDILDAADPEPPAEPTDTASPSPSETTDTASPSPSQ
jgi:peptidylprolyl isomerase